MAGGDGSVGVLAEKLDMGDMKGAVYVNRAENGSYEVAGVLQSGVSSVVIADGKDEELTGVSRDDLDVVVESVGSEGSNYKSSSRSSSSARNRSSVITDEGVKLGEKRTTQKPFSGDSAVSEFDSRIKHRLSPSHSAITSPAALARNPGIHSNVASRQPLSESRQNTATTERKTAGHPNFTKTDKRTDIERKNEVEIKEIERRNKNDRRNESERRMLGEVSDDVRESSVWLEGSGSVNRRVVYYRDKYMKSSSSLREKERSLLSVDRRRRRNMNSEDELEWNRERRLPVLRSRHHSRRSSDSREFHRHYGGGRPALLPSLGRSRAAVYSNRQQRRRNRSSSSISRQNVRRRQQHSFRRNYHRQLSTDDDVRSRSPTISSFSDYSSVDSKQQTSKSARHRIHAKSRNPRKNKNFANSTIEIGGNGPEIVGGAAASPLTPKNYTKKPQRTNIIRQQLTQLHTQNEEEVENESKLGGDRIERGELMGVTRVELTEADDALLKWKDERIAADVAHGIETEVQRRVAEYLKSEEFQTVLQARIELEKQRQIAQVHAEVELEKKRLIEEFKRKEEEEKRYKQQLEDIMLENERKVKAEQQRLAEEQAKVDEERLFELQKLQHMREDERRRRQFEEKISNDSNSNNSPNTPPALQSNNNNSLKSNSRQKFTFKMNSITRLGV